MVLRVAIVGTGPTGVYTFKHLIQSNDEMRISLFEKGPSVGVGMPYSPETASKSMLANIASIEIPPLTQTYLEWMDSLPAERLRRYNVDPNLVDERDFTPRLLLGEYFHEETLAMVEAANASGKQVFIHEDCEVTDVKALGDGTIAITCDGDLTDNIFDRVILSTGHVFDDSAERSKRFYPNPWSGLLQDEIPATNIGVMGTSLSAIDAAMAVANQHGRFVRESGSLRYETDQTGHLMITLMSWSGVLPEADFYCPMPYEPLDVLTTEALEQALQTSDSLEAIFELFKHEIALADPDWAREIGLNSLDIEQFHDAYFADRENHDAFKMARENLEEVEQNKALKKTVGWRYAILRMHEPIGDVLAELSDDEQQRFSTSWKKVFVDNYAAVPSESIRRVLALRDAKVLGLLPLGEDYKMEHDERGTHIVAHGKQHDFQVFIDARGQKPMETKHVPFPSLRAAIEKAGQEIPEVGDDFALLDVDGYRDNLYYAALPFLMHEKPFIQGITACAEIGEAIAQSNVLKRRRRKRLVAVA
jgi:uncharacterized NAD(P)/FAD-binding protein YdhS